jgi:hypothetical protein
MRRQLTTFHHAFTIQKPHPNTHFSQPPPQKAQQSNKKNSTGPPDFFLANYGFF